MLTFCWTLCLMLFGGALPLAAQAVTNTAPRLIINNYATTVGQYASLQVDVCDDHNLNSSSRVLYWNGTNVTNSATWTTQSAYYNCPVAARFTSSQTSVLGNNTVRAITCDQQSYVWYPYGPLCTDLTRTLVFTNVDVPDLTATNKPPNRSNQSVTFTVSRTANVGSTTYNLGVTCTGATSGCSLSSSTVTTTSSATVTVNFTTGAANHAGTITVRATSSDAAASYDDGTVTITNAYPNWLTVSTAQNNNDNQAMGACAASCFAATASVSTVPYISMDAPQNVTLAYHGDRVAVRPFVYADVVQASGADALTRLTLELKRGTDGKAVKFLNGDTVLSFAPGSVASRSVRMAGQFNADSSGMGSTGMYMDTLVVSGVYADHSETQRIPIKVMVVNERRSPIARGWTVAGLQRLYPQSGDVAGALITSGDGSAVYFAESGGNYVAPAGEFTALRYDTGSAQWIRTTPDSTKFYFNSSGLLTSVVTRAQRTTDFTYDSQQRLTSIVVPFWVNALGRRALTLRYTGNGSGYGLWQVEEPTKTTTANGGRITTFTVNSGDSTLRVVQDPDGGQSAFGYDGLRRLETITGRDSATSTFLYRSDNSWKLAGMQSPMVAVDTSSSGVTTNEQLVTRDTAWQTRSVPTSSTVSAAWNPVAMDDATAVVVDAGGHPARFTVDRWGQPLRSVDAIGDTTVVTRNANGQVTGTLYPTGTSDAFAYSGAFMTSSQLAGESSATYFSYGAYGQLTYTSGNGPSVQHFVGVQGRIDSTRVAGAYTTKFSYDGDLRLTQSVDPQGHTTQFSYDVSWGNQDSVRTHDGKGGKTIFDRYGRDSVSRSAGRATVTQIYDVINRPTQTFDGVNGSATTVSYVKDMPARVVDPKGQVYKTEYNALGWPVKVHDARDTTRFVEYTYSRDGLSASRKNLEGKRVATTYDAGHRVLTQFDSLAGTRMFSYPTRLKVVALSRRPAGDTIAIDSTFMSPTGWTDSVTTVLAGQSFRRQYHRHPYDNYFDSLGVTSPSGVGLLSRRWWQNNTTGRLDSLAVGTARVKFGYNADGLRSTTSWGTSITRTDGYTAEHLPASVNFNVTALSNAFKQTFATDSQGRIKTEMRFATGVGPFGADRTSNKSYQYDGLGRLTRIQHDQTDVGQECYMNGSIQVCEPFSITNVTRRAGMQYDAASNLTQETDSVSSTSVVATLLDGNRLQAWGQTSYLYDLDGNDTLRTTPAGTTKFKWSAGGLLLWAASGSDTTYYDYDAAGQLVRRRKPGNVTDRWYLWDQGQLLAELNATATVRRAEYAYFPGVDQPLAMIDSAGATHWYQQSVIGNVDGLFSVSGAVEQTLRYDDWGVLESSSSTMGGLSALRWKGLYFDGGPTSLYYARARWYDPAARRFVSQDPIGLAGGVNQYAFGGDDPVNASDPTGLYCQYSYTSDGRGGMVAGTYHSDLSGCGGGWAPLFLANMAADLNQYRRQEEIALPGLPHYPGSPSTAQPPPQPKLFVDPCEVYDDGTFWTNQIRGICRRVSGPNVNQCVAACLARQWQDAISMKGRQLKPGEKWDYVYRDHPPCYGASGYSKFEFLLDYGTGAGTWTRTPPYNAYMCARFGAARFCDGPRR